MKRAWFVVCVMRADAGPQGATTDVVMAESRDEALRREGARWAFDENEICDVWKKLHAMQEAEEEEELMTAHPMLMRANQLPGRDERTTLLVQALRTRLKLPT